MKRRLFVCTPSISSNLIIPAGFLFIAQIQIRSIEKMQTQTTKTTKEIFSLQTQDSKKNPNEMHFCEKSGRWKAGRPWRIFAAFVIFTFTFVCGLDFYLVPGALYCIDQLRNSTDYQNQSNLPDYVTDIGIRSNIIASYNWIAPLLILPMAFITQLGGAEWVRKILFFKKLRKMGKKHSLKP